jgi:Zn-dependent protease
MNSPLFTLLDFFQGKVDAITLLLVFFSIISVTLILLPFHEFAHAITAYWLGDNTAKEQGRLTLNPIYHVDPIGFGCMFLIGFGWAKPVPVNPLRANRKVTMRSFMAITAAAGPLSNILFSLVCVIIAKLLTLTGNSSDMMYFSFFALYMMSYTSLYLAVFNLIPIPPLDGSKILFCFLSNHQINMIERHMHIIRSVLLIVLLTTPFLRGFIKWGADIIMTGLDYATFFIK